MTPEESEPTVEAEVIETLTEFSGKLERQARIHAKAVEVIGKVLTFWRDEPKADFLARSILANLSHHGLLIGTADEFKE